VFDVDGDVGVDALERLEEFAPVRGVVVPTGEVLAAADGDEVPGSVLGASGSGCRVYRPPSEMRTSFAAAQYTRSPSASIARTDWMPCHMR
jgi:hypothetical protein